MRQEAVGNESQHLYAKTIWYFTVC